MSEPESDPVLDRVLLAAPVTDVHLQALDVCLALEGMSAELGAPLQRRRTAIQSAAILAVAAAVIGVVGLRGASPDEPSANPVAAEFERVASEFPLPAGVTYEALKLDSLDSDASGEKLRAEVALFSGCAWTAQLTDAELSDQIAGTTEITVALRRSYDALAADERTSLTALLDSVDKLGGDDSELRVTITQSKRAWDEICRDVR